VSSVLCYLMIIMDFTEDLWVKCVFFRLDLGLRKYVIIPKEFVKEYLADITLNVPHLHFVRIMR